MLKDKIKKILNQMTKKNLPEWHDPCKHWKIKFKF
jgi:hypothetical protein